MKKNKLIVFVLSMILLSSCARSDNVQTAAQNVSEISEVSEVSEMIETSDVISEISDVITVETVSEETVSHEDGPFEIQCRFSGRNSHGKYAMFENGNIIVWTTASGDYAIIGPEGNIVSQVTNGKKITPTVFGGNYFLYGDDIYDSNGNVIISPDDIGFDGYLSISDKYIVVYLVDEQNRNNDIYIGCLDIDGNWLSKPDHNIDLFDHGISSKSLFSDTYFDRSDFLNGHFSDSCYIKIYHKDLHGVVLYDLLANEVVLDYTFEGDDSVQMNVKEYQTKSYYPGNSIWIINDDDIFAVGPGDYKWGAFHDGKYEEMNQVVPFVMTNTIGCAKENKKWGVLSFETGEYLFPLLSNQVYFAYKLDDYFAFVADDEKSTGVYLYLKDMEGQDICEPVKLDLECKLHGLKIKDSYVLCDDWLIDFDSDNNAVQFFEKDPSYVISAYSESAKDCLSVHEGFDAKVYDGEGNLKFTIYPCRKPSEDN